VEKPERNRPLGRSMREWEDNINMDLKEVGWRHELDWSDSAKRQLAGSCKYGNEHSGFIKYGEFLD
jgi:hypothetical protein